MLLHPGAVNCFRISDQISATQDRSTTSLSNLTLARHWHQYCLENHKLCSQFTQDSKLPHMILDIADPLRPVIVMGRGRNAKYATLSYKWGDGSRFITTTKNYALFQNGINSSELPKTFADAILLANEFGFSFFWIDALCIRHDMVEELTEQISMMDSIYSASSLTIFAAWGDSAHHGLSVERDPWLIKPSEVMLKLDWNDRLLERTVYFHKRHAGTPSQEPLFTRGWVLQEQVLSLRGLIFNSDQMSWQCLTSHYDTSEATPSTIGLRDIAKSIPYHFEPTYCSSLIRSPQLHLVDQVLAVWDRLIEDYSARKLTYTSDTLSALAGLASPVSHLYSLDYVAGLWRQDVERGLLWSRAPSTMNLGRADWTDWIHSAKQAKQYTTLSNEELDRNKLSLSDNTPRSPSWSWISRSGCGEICFWGKFLTSPETFRKAYMIEVVDAIITHSPINSGPFGGEVNFGMLTITAWVQEVVIEMYQMHDHYTRYPPPHKLIRYGILNPINSKPKLGAKYSDWLIGELHLDHWSLPLYDGDVVTCIFCMPNMIHGEWINYCLAVVPTDTPDHYKRIGLASLWGSPSQYVGKQALGAQAAGERVLNLI